MKFINITVYFLLSHFAVEAFPGKTRPSRPGTDSSAEATLPPALQQHVDECKNLETPMEVIDCIKQAALDFERPTLPPALQEKLPACKDLATPEEIVACLQEAADAFERPTLPPSLQDKFPECKELETPEEMMACIKTFMQEFERPTLPPALQAKLPGCKDMETPDEIIACVDATIEELQTKIENLPACVNTTMKALGFCARENIATCVKTCQGMDIVVPDLPDSPAQIATCGLIQQNVVDPMCANNCCPQCQQEFEDFAECLVNEVIDYPSGDCDFECGGGSRRALSGLRGYKK
jgi:hypothetical protein